MTSPTMFRFVCLKDCLEEISLGYNTPFAHISSKLFMYRVCSYVWAIKSISKSIVCYLLLHHKNGIELKIFHIQYQIKHNLVYRIFPLQIQKNFVLHNDTTKDLFHLLYFLEYPWMFVEELTKWSSQGMPGDLVSSEPTSSDAVGAAVDHKAYKYLFTRCGLLKAAYKKTSEDEPDSLHR